MVKKKALRGKKKIMIEALMDQLGVVTAACKQTGISRQTHYRWLNEDANYKIWADEVPDLCLDFAENSLFGLMREGNIASVIFYLKTKGKKRGYIEKTEIEHSGGSHTFNLITKSVKEIKDAKAGNKRNPGSDNHS